MAGIRRRDFLGFLGGGVVGAALSPLPWKLLDDAAIWTQNWSWLPRLPRGPIDHVFTHCTLCPIGCGLQVRRVGGNPCGLAGVADHPVSHGALCPLGFGGHQLAFHPARLREPQRRRGGEGTQGWVPQSPQEALGQLAEWVAELRGAGAAQTLGVLDARPGRVLSDAYRRFLTAVGGGRYLVAGDRGLATEPLEEMLGAPPPGLGIDVERTGTLLSFGAPLLEGWGSPQRATRARLIQVDSRPSPTALRADV